MKIEQDPNGDSNLTPLLFFFLYKGNNREQSGKYHVVNIVKMFVLPQINLEIECVQLRIQQSFLFFLDLNKLIVNFICRR
jgi:hypothetical protein